MNQLRWSAVFIAVFLWPARTASADYTVILNNGRQISVQSYREEGGIIRFVTLGGEIAISKEQVRSIQKRSDPQSTATVTPSPTTSVTTDRSAAEPRTIAPQANGGQAQSPSGVPDERAKEEKQYEKRLKELTQQINELRDRYALLTRGNTGSDPVLFTTEEAFRGHQEDLLSRLRDAQNRAQGLETGSASKSPPFSLNPPPAYSERQKELSDLRDKMNRLETARQQLIGEMKEKNFAAGSVFIE
jgi:hypothetical protein